MAVVKQFLPQMEELLLSYSEHIAGAAVQLEILLDRIHAARKDPEQMTATVNAMAIRVNRYNQQEWDGVIKSVLGMPMNEIPFDRIHHDAEADNALRELWVSENLELIKSIDEQTMQRVKAALQERILGTVNRRELSKDLADDIQRIAGLERNRAVLIGRDQVGKLNGRLMQYRQQHAGIEEYRWSSSHDQRVRPSHRQYDGKVYTWGGKNPAPDGSPGIPIRCRCVAIPVIDLDKIVTKPVSGSYVSIPNAIRQASLNVEKQFTNLVGIGTTDTMNNLFNAGIEGNAYEIDNTIEKPFGFMPNIKKVKINPTHTAFKEYDLREAITHETVHWLDSLLGWSKNHAWQIDEAIQAASLFVLTKENAQRYKAYLSDVFAENMSISDIFSNITLNKIVGYARHSNDDYWLKYPALRRNELLADMLTIYTIGDEAGEQIIRGIPALEALYKEYVRRYVTFLRGVKRTDKGGG